MNSSFYNGIAGSKAYMYGMDVLANNIANINTVGFKSKSTEFSTVLNQTLTESAILPTANQIGLGSKVTAVSMNMNQGALMTSDNTFDLAIAGEGWFAVKYQDDTLYTRNGAFSIDANEYLTTSNGAYVQGVLGNIFYKDPTNPGIYQARLVDSIPLKQFSTTNNILLPQQVIMPGEATKNATLKANLNPLESDYAHFQMSILTTDGEEAIVDMNFQQRSSVPEQGSAWGADVMVMKFYENYNPDKVYDQNQYYVDQAANRVYTILDRKSGEIQFNGDGALIANTIPTLDNDGVPLTLNLGTPYDPAIPNSGYDGLTTLTSMATVSTSATHDGFTAGELRSYVTAEDGTIYANFSNGKSSAVARIPVYHFQNDQGLSSEGNVYFTPTQNSGQPFLYTDAQGNVIQGATIHSHMLENSNIELSTALTEMIVMQKAFDANAKSITTSDQMIQQAINMKK